MKKFNLATITLCTLVMGWSFPTFGFNMNGTWDCRLGWTWLTTSVEVSGYSQTWKEGYASVDFIKVDDKTYKKIIQRPLGFPGETPHILLENEKDKRVKIVFHQGSDYWGYRNEGVVVVIETKTFSEKEGTKWEKDYRYCKQ